MTEEAIRNTRHGIQAATVRSLELISFLAVGVVVPIVGLILIRGQDVIDTGMFSSTVIGISIASFSTFVLIRRFRQYAKAGRVAAPVLSAAIPYIILLIIIIAFRVDYSRGALVGSFVFVTLTAFFLYHRYLCSTERTIGIIPFGACAEGINSDFPTTFINSTLATDFKTFDYVAADLDYEFDDDWQEYISRMALNGIPIYHYKRLEERYSGRVDVQSLAESSFRALDPDNLYLPIKYFVDRILAAFAILLLFPVLLLIGVVIRIDSKGPALFIQERIGRAGLPFRIYKFRTMHHNWSGTGAATKQNDPRITKLGSFFRKYRIDELPQMLNILAGQMSWIGPRPESAELAERYKQDIPLYSYRHIIKPGISGWAQVHQGNTDSVNQAKIKLEYDFYYIKHVSMWLDVLTVFKTLHVIMTGFGSK